MKDSRKRHCRHRPDVIEFIGGPFDGHIESIADDDEMPPELWWMVNANVFWLLDGKPHGLRQPITSVALYNIQTRADENRYVFLGAVSLDELLAVQDCE